MSKSRPRPEPGWIIPTSTRLLPDGSTIVVPGKAVRRGTTAQVATWTKVPRKTLHRLADMGIITRSRLGFTFYFYPAEIEALIAESGTNPDLWTDEWLAAYRNRKPLRKPD